MLLAEGLRNLIHSSFPRTLRMMSDVTIPRTWAGFSTEIYLSRKPPVNGTVDIQKLEDKARETLKDHNDAFMYVNGSAGTCSTYKANLKALDKFKIIPRVLTDAQTRNVETTIFGVKHSSPLFMAPIGVQGIWHKDAELASAKAAKKVGVPFIMSTASSRSIEEVAEANGDGHRWFQLYWPRSEDITISLLKRAKNSGFKALVVTLDTMILGWRPHDIDTAYMPFGHGVGIQVGMSDPVFMARHGYQPEHVHPVFPYEPAKFDAKIRAGDEQAKRDTALGRSWLQECNAGEFKTWEDLKFLKKIWGGPLILKGILSVQDAEKAIEVGADGIIISNHGGRQVDGAMPAIYALEQICKSPKVKEAQASNKLTVLFDSGIRTGSDIIKATALGAQGILLGRPWVYGLVIGGEEGVEQVIRQTLADLDITLGLCGYKDLSEVRGKADVIVKLDL